MAEKQSNSMPMINAKVSLTVRGRRLDMQMTFPSAEVPPSAMLPLFRKVAEGMLDMSIADDEAAGKKVSCKKGCGACCRQLVPISAIEAREVAKVVEQMDEPRRKIILQRFADARQQLEDAAMLEPLLHPDQFSDEDMRVLGREYFKLGIACPFLEEESCSIYLDRPITCREYLVTSPAENCSHPTPETIKMVGLPAGPLWTAVARFEQAPASRFIRWVPLILALEFAETSPSDPAPRPGKQWVEEFFTRVAGQTKKT